MLALLSSFELSRPPSSLLSLRALSFPVSLSSLSVLPVFLYALQGFNILLRLKFWQTLSPISRSDRAVVVRVFSYHRAIVGRRSELIRSRLSPLVLVKMCLIMSLKTHLIQPTKDRGFNGFGRRACILQLRCSRYVSSEAFAEDLAVGYGSMFFHSKSDRFYVDMLTGLENRLRLDLEVGGSVNKAINDLHSSKGFRVRIFKIIRHSEAFCRPCCLLRLSRDERLVHFVSFTHLFGARKRRALGALNARGGEDRVRLAEDGVIDEARKAIQLGKTTDVVVEPIHVKRGGKCSSIGEFLRFLHHACDASRAHIWQKFPGRHFRQLLEKIMGVVDELQFLTPMQQFGKSCL
ncbi:hypothetical protein L484_002646 [Morus notabilis]|uniref:Uncharacterized protein n=1 Tax=Morus notabilis TaxID=981085 RepID=W9RQW7_9ROSA|nr:hypothetical protein L484_002646 [Morus notabilis]